MTTHFKRIVGLTPRQWLHTATLADGSADAARSLRGGVQPGAFIPVSGHVGEAGTAEQRVRVRINLSLLRENLSKADGRQWTEAEVDRWLRDAKFTSDGDGWIVREADLGQLEPEEVASLEEVERDKP